MEPEIKYTTSRDGTKIAYYVLGRGPRTWLAAPAMGAPFVAMRRVYQALAEHVRVVTWDMRGFHRSGVPADPRALDVPRHVEDLQAVARAEGLGRFVLGGWSMGVPISLELFAQEPERVESLVLINGPFTAALDQALPVPIPGLGDAVAGVLGRMGGVGRLANPLSVSLLGRRGLGRLLERVGVIAREPEYFEEILADFRHVDWGRYMTVIQRLHEYDGAPHLAKIRVPTLVTGGTRDPMTPEKTARALADRIRGAELFVVKGGTHYTPAEFPDLVAERIVEFLKKHPG
jgi:pimeloyl-ACP methyl ester carboxylesterase